MIIMIMIMIIIIIIKTREPLITQGVSITTFRETDGNEPVRQANSPGLSPVGFLIPGRPDMTFVVD